jgi:glycosyltransferase involved in cell wall biosynthesis|tara:strand:- start:14035 stop:14748 length:714 start_codon:yes stop_codon:yes gene_type:complete
LIKSLSIIIPVFNESLTIYKLLDTVNNLVIKNDIRKEIIVINDFSKDNSKKEILRFIKENKSLSITFIENDFNVGKGGSIKEALKIVSGDYCIIQDADLELNPEEINDLLDPVLNNKADIVYGSRFINSKKKKKESILNRIANKLLTALGNFCFGVKLTDMQTCYKLIPTEIFKKLDLKENRFAFDPEVTAKLAKNKNLRWKEIPINYNPRTVDEGKKIRWRDGFRALFSILRYGLF